MRIRLYLSRNTQLVPYNYKESIVSKIHELLGENEIHDTISLYTFSNLHFGKSSKNGLDFKEGSYFDIASFDQNILKNIIDGIMKGSINFSYGMTINEIRILPAQTFHEQPQRFLVDSPVLIKRSIDNKNIHYTYKNSESEDLLKETLLRKMDIANLKDDTLKIYFDKSYSKPKEKLITYKDILNKCSICPIIIEGKPETKSFAYDVGIGNSTGIGFGFLNL